MTPQEPEPQFAVYNPRDALMRSRRQTLMTCKQQSVKPTHNNAAPIPSSVQEELEQAQKIPPTWEWEETGCRCQRWTKSEARAVFKKAGGHGEITIIKVVSE